MKKTLSLLLFAVLFLGINKAYSQERFNFGAEYTGDFLYNVGGLKNGGGYLGYAKIGMDANLWKGASL